MQAAPRRRNPLGSRGLRPHTSSLVVSDHSGQLPPRFSSVACKPLLRDPREFVTTLLTTESRRPLPRSVRCGRLLSLQGRPPSTAASSDDFVDLPGPTRQAIRVAR